MSSGYNHARDAFIYLLSYATLLIFTVALNFLTKSLIDRVVPDATRAGGFLGDDITLIGFLAAVLIAFPIFWYVNWRANKMLAKKEMKPESAVRHWLIYITLVVVILIIIWQLIALIVAFLSGEAVLRFVLGVVVTLLIAAGVLVYQWWHLRAFSDSPLFPKSWFKIFEWKSVIAVLAVLVWGFVSVGSPAEQRANRFDEIRVERLRGIQYAIENFYGIGLEGGEGRLPESLGELQGNSRYTLGDEEIIDPKTKEVFEYNRLSATQYELCAEFETENEMTNISPRVPDFAGKGSMFSHSEGRNCFELSVV